MKKVTSLFALFFIVLCVAFVSVIATLNLSAQDGNQLQPADPTAVFETKAAAQQSTFLDRAASSPFQDSNISVRARNPKEAELIKLRSEYVSIATAKAQLMTEDELREAVGVASEEFTQLRAKKELESAVSKLKAIVEQYPNSDAAREAKQLLDAKKATAGENGPVDDSAGDEGPARRNFNRNEKPQNYKEER